MYAYNRIFMRIGKTIVGILLPFPVNYILIGTHFCYSSPLIFHPPSDVCRFPCPHNAPLYHSLSRGSLLMLTTSNLAEFIEACTNACNLTTITLAPILVGLHRKLAIDRNGVVLNALVVLRVAAGSGKLLIKLW